MKNKIVIALAALFYVFCSFAQVNLISGNWMGVMKLPDQGSRPLNFSFILNNDSLTGTTNSLTEFYDVTEGKVKGDSIWFVVLIRDQSRIPFTGKYYSNGDSISLNQLFRNVNVHTTLQRRDINK